MPKKLLIIGAGMATAYLLRELHSLDHGYDIVVVGEEQEACYNRVLLSNVLSGENTECDLRMLGTETSRPVEFVTATRIQSVDRMRRRAFSVDGRHFDYDRLVLATGASVARPPLDFTGIGGVVSFRTLEDTRHLQRLAQGGGRAVVAGGGLLGLEAAHGLNRLGFDTTVLHRNQFPMNRQLDKEGGTQLQRNLESSGIAFKLGTCITDYQTAGKSISALRLDDGYSLPCNLLVFATGITPNTELSVDMGPQTERGILVDGWMRTSDDYCYALGECAQYQQHCFGLVAPIREQAHTLANVLAELPTQSFSITDWPTQLKISGIDIFSAGELDDDCEQLILRDEARGVYRRLVIRDTRLIGAVLVGDKRGGTWYGDLIKNGNDISAFRSGLMFGREVSEAQLSAAA